MLKRVLHTATALLKVKNCVSLLRKATVRISGTKSWSGLSLVTLPTTRRIFTAPQYCEAPTLHPINAELEANAFAMHASAFLIQTTFLILSKATAKACVNYYTIDLKPRKLDKVYSLMVSLFC